MALLKLNTTKSGIAFSEEVKQSALAANALLHSGKGAGNDFLGWVNLPSSIDKAYRCWCEDRNTRSRCPNRCR